MVEELKGCCVLHVCVYLRTFITKQYLNPNKTYGGIMKVDEAWHHKILRNICMFEFGVCHELVKIYYIKTTTLDC
jgi:hypothetical protein